MKAGSRVIAIALAAALSAAALAQQNSNPTSSPDDSTADNASSDTSAPDSHVRIVRLSEITGAVEVDRNIGAGFEPALLNLPIVEGEKLRTAAGFAEVEFEDGSTLRLTPFTAVAFDQLRLQPSGATATTVYVQAGMVYVSMARTKDNPFHLSFANQSVQLTPSSHVRLYLKGQWASVDVLHGKITAETPTGARTVKNRTVNFHLVDTVEVSENANAAAPYDDWDNQAIEYHHHYAKTKAYGNPGDVDGIADMNYYGSFASVVGCGVIWRPYFASPTWDPFANGSWVLYPGWGYAWVSPYPWGWTAYHFGQWNFCPGVGWGWQPLPGQFRILPIVGKIPPGYHLPPPPPRPRPTPRQPQVVTVNHAPAVASQIVPSHVVSAPSRLELIRGSAGLGVPRGNLSLSQLSQRAEQQGLAKVNVWSTPMVASDEHGSFTLAHSPGGIAGKTGSSSSYVGKPGSYSGERSSSSYTGRSSGGGYSGGRSGGGYSGGGGHSSRGGGGGGGRGR